MNQFIDDDRGYLHWLQQHPAGFVLNCERRPRPAYLLVHRASCRTIQGVPPRGATWTGPYIKVCSSDRHQLAAWAMEHVGGKLQACKICQP